MPIAFTLLFFRRVANMGPMLGQLNHFQFSLDGKGDPYATSPELAPEFGLAVRSAALMGNGRA